MTRSFRRRWRPTSQTAPGWLRSATFAASGAALFFTLGCVYLTAVAIGVDVLAPPCFAMFALGASEVMHTRLCLGRRRERLALDATTGGFYSGLTW